MSAGGAVAAVDLGATSGRVMIGRVSDGMLSLEPVARFPNGPVEASDGLHWDFTALYGHIVAGLREAVEREPALASVGIDSWAVDYGLVKGGRVLGGAVPLPGRAHPARCRRRARDRAVRRALPPQRPAVPGVQHALPVRHRTGPRRSADVALLIPDLVAFLLTGAQAAERTNASTTGLVDVHTGEWDLALAERLGITASVLPPLVDPGTHIGALHRRSARREWATALEVVAVGSHDTASAVVAVPLTSPNAAYISCGTWGLVGVELDEPVVSDEAREANFTNEGGVDGRVRFLHNITGLWLLASRCGRGKPRMARASTFRRCSPPRHPSMTPSRCSTRTILDCPPPATCRRASPRC